MSKFQQYADFSNGKQCIVCNSSANVRSMPLMLDNKSYVAPVCSGNVCRHHARNNTSSVSSSALGASKLLETDLGFKLNH